MKKFLLCILPLLLMIFLSGCTDSTPVSSELTEATAESTSAEATTTAAATTSESETTAQQTTAVTTTEKPSLTEDWKLLLINSRNPVPKDYTLNLKEISEGISVDKRIVKNLKKLLEDAHAEGYKLVIVSAYRTKKEQKKIYNGKKDEFIKRGYSEKEAVKLTEGWVAKPGRSEHQTGLAVDINPESGKSAEAYKWLAKNCIKYGFIVRYPTEKSDITGINHEPWHFRYVGKEHAKKMKSKNLTLEEYIKQIRKSEKANNGK